MFFSSFFAFLARHIGETIILGAKLVKISHIRKRNAHFFVIKSIFASFSLLLFPFVSRCMPPICHLFATYLHRNIIGTSLESHRNLIGTSPNDERIFKQLSPKYHLYLQLCLLSSGVPENARGVLGCLTNVIRVCL